VGIGDLVEVIDNQHNYTHWQLMPAGIGHLHGSQPEEMLSTKNAG
jgi:hypothetical protein